MLIPHNHPSARGRAPVNPHTGLMFQHVRALDTERGLLEFYSTTLAHPDVPMIIGGKEIAGYTLVFMRDGDGTRFIPTRQVYCAFDLVDLATGEVVAEVAGPPCPLQYADPAAYWDEQNRRAGGVWGPLPAAPPAPEPETRLDPEAEKIMREKFPDHPTLKRAEMERLLRADEPGPGGEQ